MKTRHIIIFISAIIAIFVLIEISYRVVKGPVPVTNENNDSFCITDKVLGYRFRPGAIAPQGKDVNCINNVGLRGDDVSIPKDKNYFRILCIGDSSTNGVNAHNKETYPGILQEFFNDTELNENIKIEVINAGVPGYLSDHHLYLMDKYLQLEPDLIIFMMGVTDVSAILESNTTWDAIRNIKRDDSFLPPGLENFLQDHSSAYYWGSRALRDYIDIKRLERDEKKDITKEIEKGLESYRKNYQAMIDKCKEHGVVVININFPWNFTSRVGREDNYTHLKDEIKYFEFNLYWQAMPILARTNQELADKNNIANIDLQPYILKAKNRLILFGEGDFDHPSIAGNFFIASQAYSYIATHVLADKIKTKCNGIKLADKYLLGISLEK